VTNRRSLPLAAVTALALAACARHDDPRPEPRRADPVAFGVFQIVGRPPGAAILIDGVRSGQVPSRIRVSADEPHEIRVEAEGYQPYTITQTLEKEEERTLRVPLDPLAAPKR
jgi:hypothetical protein